MADNTSTPRSDKRKQSLYFPETMLAEIKDEAARLDRSLSWVVQRAWKLARSDIRKIPSVNDIGEETET
ncbi:MAG: TIGR04563 family protein [Pseudomonadota bacterium]